MRDNNLLHYFFNLLIMTK